MIRYKTGMHLRIVLAVFLSLVVPCFGQGIPGDQGAPRPRFEFKDGDRVVFLGDTMIEREQAEGYIETSIT